MMKCLLICAAVAQTQPFDRFAFAIKANTAIGRMMECDLKAVTESGVADRVNKKVFGGATNEELDRLLPISNAAMSDGLKKQKSGWDKLDCKTVVRDFTALAFAVNDIDPPPSPKAPQ